MITPAERETATRSVVRTLAGPSPTAPSVSRAFNKVCQMKSGLAMVHVRASGPGRPDAAVADIYRFEAGRIVEHWDVLQPVPERPVHDHPMF